MGSRATLLEAPDMGDLLKRITDDIFNHYKNINNMALIGIHTRGVYLARRIQKMIQQDTGTELPAGAVDINLYRDDWTRVAQQPVVKATDIAFDINDKQIILIDDVLFTGRTVRAALDAIMDFGRPARIELAVLIDRGHRELPIQPDYAGKIVDTRSNQAVNVLLAEIDGIDRVDIITG